MVRRVGVFGDDGVLDAKALPRVFGNVDVVMGPRELQTAQSHRANLYGHFDLGERHVNSVCDLGMGIPPDFKVNIRISSMN